MSATQATLYGALIAGVFTLLGIVVGLVVEYQLRRRGEVRSEARAWSGAGRKYERDEFRSFKMRFFNDRDVNIYLWDARAEFYRGAELIDTIPAWRAEGLDGVELVGPIDLESRKSVYPDMEVIAYGEETLDRLKSADRVEFVATTIPGGGSCASPSPSGMPSGMTSPLFWVVTSRYKPLRPFRAFRVRASARKRRYGTASRR